MANLDAQDVLELIAVENLLPEQKLAQLQRLASEALAIEARGVFGDESNPAAQDANQAAKDRAAQQEARTPYLDALHRSRIERRGGVSVSRFLTSDEEI